MGEVDAVVTWVDASCPLWQEARARYAADAPAFRFSPPEAPEAEVDLCLSLLVQNLPWLRRVWVVTMRPQKPSCLSRPELRDRVSLVHHDEFFLGAYSPTFSSHAIEANLWRLPGLAEKFVYLNDDMYVLRPLPERVFFDVGRPVAWLSKSPPWTWAYHEDEYNRAWLNLRDLLPHAKLLHHFPYALTKTNLREAAARFADRWTELCGERVRTVRDIPPVGAAINLGVAEGRGVRERLPKARFRGAVVKPGTVEALVGRDLCFLCVNRQPFDKTRAFCDAVRACFVSGGTALAMRTPVPEDDLSDSA
jgi:hypothetical protein